MHLGDAFEKMSPHVLALAKGLGDMGRNIMPGLNKAFDQAGPFIDAMAEGLRETGAALGTFFADVSASKGAVDGLEFTFQVLNGTLIMSGKLIRFLSDQYHRWLGLMAVLTGLIEDIPALPANVRQGWSELNNALEDTLIRVRRVPNAIDSAGGSVHSFGEAADLATRATGALSGALTVAHSKFLDFQGAEISAEEALDRLRDALKESGGSLNVHTEKGRAAREALLRVAEASAIAAQKKFDEIGSVEQAQKVYERYRDDLIKTLVGANKTRKEAERLADAWLGVPPVVKTKVITTYIDQYKTMPGEHSGPRIGEARAAGGPVLPGVPYRINERGMETVTFPASGQVHPANLKPVSGAMTEARVVIDVRGGDDELKRLIRKWVRIDGGGSVQTAFGR
jgi:hypothetical protein